METNQNLMDQTVKENVSYTFFVGSDNGNSSQKIIIDGELCVSPNVNAEISVIPENENKELNSVVKDIHEELIISCSLIKGKNRIMGTYLVGERANKSSYACDSIDIGASNSKLDADLILINTDGHVAAHAVKRYFLENNTLPKDIEVNVNLATSLPVKQYNITNKRKFAARFMEDYNHEIVVHIKQYSVKVKIKYDFVLVVPESIPVVHALKNYDKEGWLKYINSSLDSDKGLFEDFEASYSTENNEFKVTKDTFNMSDILHIAPGEGTTEYPLTRGILFDDDFIHGSDNGIGIAIENALPSYKEEMRLTKFTRQQYAEIIKDESHRYYSKAIKHLRPHLKPEAKAILKNMRSELEKANNDVDYIVVHGGGSIMLREQLFEPMKNHARLFGIKMLYVPQEYAVILESVGLYELCISDLFRTVKEKYIES